MIRVDKDNPWHFIYENSGKHYFWNSTTTYWILGWKDEKIIEKATFGTGAGENTGGGWINGRGNTQMTMLRYYAIMKEIFEKTAYWKLNPHNEWVSFGNLCLANEGQEYLIYSRVQHCRVKLPKGQKYSVTMVNPQTGEEKSLPDADSDVDNNAWQYRLNLSGDWVFILKRK